MARQRLGQKKLQKYAQQAGLTGIVYGLVRGGTDHRVNLYEADGTTWYYWPATGQLDKADYISIPPSEVLTDAHSG